MTIDVMTIDEFEDLLDRCGDDVAAWPAEYREAGLALLRSSPAARDLVEEAWSMRQAFASSPAPKAPAGLADRIVSRASASSQSQVSDIVAKTAVRRPAGSLRPAIILSCCFAVGFALSLLPSGGGSPVADAQTRVAVDVPALLSGLWQ